MIERVLVNDQKLNRFRNFRKSGLLMDGKDVITSNMDLKPVILLPFKAQDWKMVDLYFKELYDNNQYSRNKYN